MTVPQTGAGSFEAIALPHLDTLYRVALRLSGDRTRAEDLVQDTLFKAFRAWDRFRQGSNARAWLLTILRNTFINEYRRRQLEPVAVESVETIEPPDVYRKVEQVDPEGAFFASIVDERVQRALLTLSPEFREVVTLSDVEGLPYGEIAEVLGVPVGTVKSRLFRARRLLQQELYEHAVEMGYIAPRRAS